MGLLAIFGVMHLRGLSSRLSLFKKIKVNKEEMKLILVQSSPLILQYGISIASWEIFYILIERNCTVTDLAVSNTMRNVFGLFGCFGWSLAAASNAMVSNVIGQKKNEEVIPLIRKIVTIGVSVGAVLYLLLNLFPRFFLSVYGQGSQFIKEGIPVLRVVSVVLIMQPAATIWLNAVVGTGNSKKKSIFRVDSYIGLCFVCVAGAGSVSSVNFYWLDVGMDLLDHHVYAVFFIHEKRAMEGKNNLMILN